MKQSPPVRLNVSTWMKSRREIRNENNCAGYGVPGKSGYP